MNIVEDQLLKFKLINEEYLRKKDAIDAWYVAQMWNASVEVDSTKAESLVIAISSAFSIPAIDMMGKNQKRTVVDCRYCIMYVLHTKMKLGPSSIARLFSKDHSSVCHAIGEVESWLEYPKQHEEQIRLLNQALAVYEGREETFNINP